MKIRYLFPTLLAILLMCVWISSQLMNPGREHYFQHLFVLVVLLGIIFFADALEVAYSMLRYKHLEQFGGAERTILQGMHDHESLVYEAREWLVTILIIVITLMAEFPAVYFFKWEIRPLQIPGVFSIEAKTLFSALFTAIIVLWFAQGPSKTIGRDYPQQILGLGSLVWTLIAAVGRLTKFLGLDGPSDLVSSQIKKLPVLKEDVYLKPSDNAYFIASLQRYGYCIHEQHTEISLGLQGECIATQRVLYYLAFNTVSAFERHLLFDALPSPAHLSLKSVSTFRGPLLREDDPARQNETVLRQLDLICKNGSTAGIANCLFSAVPANVSVIARPDPENRYRMQYWIDTHGSVAPDTHAVAIRVEFSTLWNAGAFKVQPNSSDYFYMKIDCPCYRYKLTINPPPLMEFTFANIRPEAYCGETLHWGESDRLQNSLCLNSTDEAALNCELLYPFPGTRYKLSWTTGD